ncbi:hypothetical protein [Pseudomarimonas salicorniae]|uniref:Sugar efflux transporter for intercellular exchange n=1 Tax=Pseudomarimonas salicorniae TaxID=2933270 RepID=A0ABT0GFC0_9GAMM|nr:hypothetical protein [Lysobacter sp. CAU 1642]MCK7593241.1 hypothetical protein [Lysobacter sp. CAU 1642]
MSHADIVGWIATLVLVLTLGHQAWRQWRREDGPGVPPLLFAGQCTASILFIAYSAMVGSAIFVVANSLILVTALAGFAGCLLRTRQA